MKIREGSLRKIISESIKNKLLMENRGILSMFGKLRKKYPDAFINIQKEGKSSGEVQIISGGEVILYMSLMSSPARSLNSQKKLGCNNAYEVTWVENSSGLSIGPLLYDIVIELLSLVGSGLKPDSSAVSHPVYGADPDMGANHGFANNIWLYILYNRPDLKKTKIDPFPFSFTSSKADDCWPASMLDNWYADRHPDYTKFFKSSMKKRKGKFYPSSEQAHKWLKSFGDETPIERPGYGGIDSGEWWNKKSRVNKKYIDKVMPKAHRDEFEADWKADRIPLAYMLSKDSYPVLEKMKKAGMKITSNWTIFSGAITVYNRM